MPEPKSGASTNSATPAYEKLPFNKRREPLTGKPLRGKRRSGGVNHLHVIASR
jgi:hypothetical protein